MFIVVYIYILRLILATPMRIGRDARLIAVFGTAGPGPGRGVRLPSSGHPR